MSRINRKQLFAARLASRHSTDISKDEIRRLEAVFGPGSIRFKLDRDGAGKLFETLGEEFRDKSASDKRVSSVENSTEGRN